MTHAPNVITEGYFNNQQIFFFLLLLDFTPNDILWIPGMFCKHKMANPSTYTYHSGRQEDGQVLISGQISLWNMKKLGMHCNLYIFIVKNIAITV